MEMAISGCGLWWVTIWLLPYVLILDQSSSNGGGSVGGGGQTTTALYVFGDSLVDTGNNNFLNSLAKSNYYPYGIDLRGPTGRFCNGNTFIDYLGAWLGLPPPPPFADPATTGARILGGVNYASAAAGILDESGQHYGERYSLSQQVIKFEATVTQLRTMMTGPKLSEYLAKSIAVMVIGSNDYINNYLIPPSLYPYSTHTYTPPDFANLLLNNYARQILALHSVGLRKIVVAGIGPAGCIPNQLATGQAPPGRCVDFVNQMVGMFNEGLRSLVDILNNGTHPGSVFVYANTFAVFGDILNNHARYGFSVWDRACCGIGRNQGQITCVPYVAPCSNRSQYVFWDAFHPTQLVNAILAQRAYSGSPSDCHPINLQQLAAIHF